MILCMAMPPATLAATPGNGPLPDGRWEYPPVTIDQPDTAPRPVAWVEPPPLDLPSDEDLATTTLKGRTYHIVRRSKGGADAQYRRWLASQGRAPEGFDPKAAFAVFDADDESPAFIGSGGAGRFSRERLIVEDCTFLIDFAEGDFEKFDPLRSAIYVEGYREVVVRRSVFISMLPQSAPIRRAIASIYAADCVRVKVEDCYFEGRTTGWRGHINLWGCGPTHIDRVEINGNGGPAGGIWVATGVGEGKIGFPHQDSDPKLTIYPPGPLRIENAHIHSQKGKENSDGIYIQSVRPYLVRNCKVERWGDDSLIDVGFRDTSKPFGGRFAENHGGLGVVERCEFADGWIKDSVGLGGGLVFRYNRVRNAFFFPYAFDGGSWYVVSNRFDPIPRVLVSGRNNQTDGWTPGEGMLARGGKMVVYNNVVRKQGGAGGAFAAMFVAGGKPGPVTRVVRSDFNIYDVAGLEQHTVFAIEHDGARLSLEKWREATGNDGHSVIGPGGLERFAEVDPGVIGLPGGEAMRMRMGPAEIGLTGPVGVADPATMRRAREHSARINAEAALRRFGVEIEALPIDEGSTLAIKKESRTWAGGRGYLTLSPTQSGQRAAFRFTAPDDRRYYLWARLLGGKGSPRFRVLIDGQPVAEDVTLTSERRGSVELGQATLTGGEHTLTLESLGPGAVDLDGLSFTDAREEDHDRARAAAIREQQAAAKARQARVDAATVRIDLATLDPVGRTHGHTGVYGPDNHRYRLWQPEKSGDPITLPLTLPDGSAKGRYRLRLVLTQQQDRATIRASVDDQPLTSAPVRTAGVMDLGEVVLGGSPVHLTLRLEAAADGVRPKLRMDRIDLVPLDADPPGVRLPP